MTTSKLRLSRNCSSKLEHLSNRLDLKRNIICRIAIGRSLKNRERIASIKIDDNAGIEFNRYTLTGDLDIVLKALIQQHAGGSLQDDELFPRYLRNHIERGIDLMYSEFERINSPVEFLTGYIYHDGARAEVQRRLDNYSNDTSL